MTVPCHPCLPWELVQAGHRCGGLLLLVCDKWPFLRSLGERSCIRLGRGIMLSGKGRLTQMQPPRTSWSHSPMAEPAVGGEGPRCIPLGSPCKTGGRWVCQDTNVAHLSCLPPFVLGWQPPGMVTCQSRWQRTKASTICDPAGFCCCNPSATLLNPRR